MWRFSSLALLTASLVALPAIALEDSRPLAVVTTEPTGPLGEASLRVVALRVGRDVLQVVTLHEAADGALFIALEDLPALSLNMSNVLRLQQEAIGDCLRCIAVASLGRYTEDAASATATIQALPAFASPQQYSLTAGGPALSGPSYRGRAGFYTNYDLLASRYVASAGFAGRRAETGFGLIASPTLSLGSKGILRSGALIRSDGKPLLADTFYEKQLPDRAATLRLGDSRTQGDLFGGGTRITGIHWQKNFNFRPQELASPFYQYAFDTRSPGVVEIYRDGLLSGQQSYDPGTVTLQNLPASAQGDVRLVVRSVAGGEQVIYLPLFGDPTLLPKGVAAYSGSLGALRRPYGLGGGAAGGEFQYGVNAWMNLLGNTEASQDLQRLGFGTLLSSPVGRFQLAGAAQRLDHHITEYGRADWRYSYSSAGAHLDLGANLLWLPQTAGKDATVYNSYASYGNNRYAASLNVGGTNGKRSVGIGAGANFGASTRGQFSVAASVNKVDGRAAEFGLRFAWSPRLVGKSVRLGLTARGDENDPARQLIADASLTARPYAVQAIVGQRVADPTGSDFQLRGSVDAAHAYASVDAAHVAGAERETARLSGAVVADEDGHFFTSPIPDNGGYVLVRTGIAGAVVEQGGRRYRSDAQGRAVVPVAAYRPVSPTVDYSSVPNGRWLDNPSDWGQIFPGQKAVVDWGSSTGFLLILPSETRDVTLNGRRLDPVGLFVQVSGTVPGTNILRIDNVAYRFEDTGAFGRSGLYQVDQAHATIVAENTP